MEVITLKAIGNRLIFLLVGLVVVGLLVTAPLVRAQEMEESDLRLGSILFVSSRAGNEDIYVMDADGSNVKRLTYTSGERRASRNPRWSPDGKKIVFESNRDDGGAVNIYVMDADGSNVRRLTSHKGRDYVPRWSWDGRRILFVSNRDGNHEIYVMEPDGSNPQRLTYTPGEGIGSFGPRLSPDGKRIAFTSSRDTNSKKRWENMEIYVMDADGANVQRLTRTPGKHRGSWAGNWSPDGKRIAFTSDLEIKKGNREIYVMDADGSNEQQLTHATGKGRGSFGPRWSPDGKKIAFNSDRDGNLEIYAMDADGSNVKRLTNNKSGDWHPNWSPDGKRILFHSERDGTSKNRFENFELYLMDADGSNVKRLTFNKKFDGHPNWWRYW